MTGRWSYRALAASGLLALGVAVAATRPHAVRRALDQAPFVAAARDGTRRYASQQAAIDDGFTRVGVEFPAMGEHWVSFARVMEDTLDPRRPSVLIYVNGDGGPRLAGVAYTRLLGRGDRPPAFPYDGAWHEHSGAVSDESLPLAHAAHATHAAMSTPDADSLDDPPRLFILHAWIWTPNPDGAFVTDNWTLPLVRHGVAAPQPAGAVRELALAGDRDGYYALALRASLSSGALDDSIVGTVLSRHRARAIEEARVVTETRQLAPDRAARLAARWDALWTDLAAALPRRARELRALRERM